MHCVGFLNRCSYEKVVLRDRGRVVRDIQISAFIATAFTSVMRTATAIGARPLSVLSVRVAEELSVFCPKTGFRTLQ